MLNKEIEKSIYDSLKDKVVDIPLSKCLDLFEKIIYYNANNKELDGVKFNWESALTTIFDEDSSFADVKKIGNLIFNIESLLKKVLFIINEDEYNRLVLYKEGLASLMKYLDIDPYKQSNYQAKYKIAYELRNLTSHQASEYPRDVFYNNIEACIITVLIAIYKNYKELSKINYYAASIEATKYMNEIIDSFKLKTKKYINLDGSEDIRRINTQVLEEIETIDDINEDEVKEPRTGEIDNLRKRDIPEKKMLLLAEAGMGKTTTIEYLAYIDAKERLDDFSAKIPVLLYLNLLIDPKLTIIDYIAKKMEISIEDVKNLLEHGEINLFLDGLNEIPNITELRNARLTEINFLVKYYKNTFIIISTRPQTSNLIHNIPKFNLLSMDNTKQNLFIERNCFNSATKNLILEAITNNKKIKRVVSTPLFLSIFIKVVDVTKQIPTSEGNLIKVFINSLLEREINEKNNLTFDVKKGNYLLRSFAYFVKEKYKANSGVIESEIIECFADSMQKYSYYVDALDYLSIFIDLGILNKKDDLYCFYHESYQDYFYSEELRFILGSQKISPLILNE